MKSNIILLVILIHSSTIYAEECTYNQPAQISLLESIAKSHPGSKLDIKLKTLSWSSDKNTASLITYGGCHHLSFTVTKNKKLTQEESLKLATSLAEEYWEKSDAILLTKGIKEKTYTLETSGSSTFIIYRMSSTLNFM